MNRRVSIIMYHYVRELDHSRYPEIKGLAVDQFIAQIAYIKRHYQIISAYDLMDAVQTGAELPPRALLLTFDDAYSDHFRYVYPILDRERLPGCFFPAAKCILERRLLDVNKIHFILASVPDKFQLVEEIKVFVDQSHPSYNLETNQQYWDRVAVPSRWDPPEVIFIKRMLQRELPEALRETITDALFQKYVSRDEAAFAEELYMSVEQIAHLGRNGMYIGSHGFDHYWLNTLASEAQQREVDLAVKFLNQVGSDTSRWVMCYPNGSWNESLLQILAKNGCILGLTTAVGIANLDVDNLLTLPRLNTNDLPKQAGAAANEWTLKGIG
jgi:peptidoglycan/xylan/chitin deacetylase (PgdA/CDA1 family)